MPPLGAAQLVLLLPLLLLVLLLPLWLLLLLLLVLTLSPFVPGLRFHNDCPSRPRKPRKASTAPVASAAPCPIGKQCLPCHIFASVPVLLEG